jgi:glycosyltransferase involved in cell wall biosynthesis
VRRFVTRSKNAIFLVAGEGPSAQGIRDSFKSAGLGDRVHMAGVLEGRFLASAYQAMDVFAFASTSETQGLVIAEAMAAGVPVVALDGPGVREVVSDERNGRLITGNSVDDFQAGLDWVASLQVEKRMELSRNARKAADGLSIRRCAEIALAHYESLLRDGPTHDHDAYDAWTQTFRLIEAEWSVLKGVAEATGAALQGNHREGQAEE